MEDLKQTVLQTLEAKGALDSVKDKARSLAQDCISNQRSQPPPDSLGEEGRLCVHIVRDFLSYCKFQLSLNVFEPETGLTSAIPPAQLAQKLGFQPQQGRPLLLQLLERAEEGDSMELLQDQSFASSQPDDDPDFMLP